MLRKKKHFKLGVVQLISLSISCRFFEQREDRQCEEKMGKSKQRDTHKVPPDRCSAPLISIHKNQTTVSSTITQCTKPKLENAVRQIKIESLLQRQRKPSLQRRRWCTEARARFDLRQNQESAGHSLKKSPREERGSRRAEEGHQPNKEKEMVNQ